MTPRGRIALVHVDGKVDYLPVSVPMNQPDLEALSINAGFRVADIVLHERLPDTFTLFVSHHYFAADCIEFRISSTELKWGHNGVAISDRWKTEFIANPCIGIDVFLHNAGWGGIQVGGRMVMEDADHLLVAIGDNGWYGWDEADERHKSRITPSGFDARYHLGKLVRIDTGSGKAEILSRGLRNPQGLALDSAGNIWETEHGPQGGDELNLLRPERHYGWPYVTLGLQYIDKIWPFNNVQGSHDGFEMPVYSWVPSIAISNLIVSDSQMFPLWENDLLIASLKAQSLFRVRVHDERVIYSERIEIGTRIRDIVQTDDGRIALLTDDAKVLLLQRAPIFCHDEFYTDAIYSFDANEVCLDVSTMFSEANAPIIRNLKASEFGKPLVRSLFYLYVHDNKLLYLRSPCTEYALSHRFFLHITPVHADDLTEEYKQHGFNIYDFYSQEQGIGAAVNEAGCMVALELPEYEIKRIYTGQSIRVESPTGEVSWQGPIWEGRHTFAETEPATVEHPGATLFSAHCAGCHSLAEQHSVGPHLAGIVGRRAGNIEGFDASSSLSSLDIVWTEETLAQFIADPARFAPGTSMLAIGITEEEAQVIVDFLALER